MVALLMTSDPQQASGRHLIIVDIINAEENFIDCMSLAVERFTNPLRHQMLTAAQHDNLFQNIDKVGDL